MTMRLAMAVLVTATWMLGSSVFAATPTPAPTVASTAASRGRDDRRSHATPSPRATAQDSSRRDAGSDDGTLRRLFRSLDDTQRDHGNRKDDDRDRH